ncbi:MAG TPA: cytochrome P450 [Acidimicrobiia bacterium]|nr:cytochrome P450 [Acidimicrobiia bacterium]
MTDITELLFDPATADEPHDAYRQIRSECPVARVEGLTGEPTVYVSRYADVMWALRHPEVFSSGPGAVEIGQDQPLIPLQVDPPDHAKYRRMLDPEFSPKKMAALEPHVRALASEMIDRFVDRGACNFHEDFATPFPSAVFLRLMGLPQSDLATFLQWRDDTIRPDTNDIDEATRIRAEAGHAIAMYFESALEDRRANPDDGLLSRLAHAEVEGRPLTKDESLGVCHLLLLAGLDTVTATLDCMVAHLARNPDRRRQIVDDPELVPAAVEELLRWETPVAMVIRVVAQDTTFAGVDVKAGDGCAAMIGAADGDDTEFDRADEVDFTREANRHVAFGAGPHRCLGSHLARMELHVALEELHRRIPDYRIADGAEIHHSPGIRQADHLPLTWSPAS